MFQRHYDDVINSIKLFFLTNFGKLLLTFVVPTVSGLGVCCILHEGEE